MYFFSSTFSGSFISNQPVKQWTNCTSERANEGTNKQTNECACERVSVWVSVCQGSDYYYTNRHPHSWFLSVYIIIIKISIIIIIIILNVVRCVYYTTYDNRSAHTVHFLHTEQTCYCYIYIFDYQQCSVVIIPCNLLQIIIMEPKNRFWYWFFLVIRFRVCVCVIIIIVYVFLCSNSIEFISFVLWQSVA